MLKELQGLLYHGSFTEVSKVELLKCAPKKDFGTGFYTTISKTQAVSSLKFKEAYRVKTN